MERRPEIPQSPAESTALRRRARPKRSAHGARSRPLRAWLARVALRGVGALSFTSVWRLGGWLGRAAAWFPSRSRDATRVNLGLCLPELGAAERAKLERASLIEATRTALELGALWTWERERVLGLVRQVSGAELAAEALAQKRGIIGLTPHLGAWEMVGLHIGAHFPFTAVYRAPRAPELEELYNRCRTRFGTRLVPADSSGVRALYRVLERGEVCGILPDQDPGRGAGIYAPFFGVLANTNVLVARLAHKFGAPVIFCWAERLPHGQGFHLHFERGSPAIGDADVEVGTRALNADIERLVRRCPAQYLWSYKRFRYPPPGAANPYKDRHDDQP